MEPPATFETTPSSAGATSWTSAAPDGPACTIERNEELLVKRTLIRAFLENVPDLVYFKDRESRFIAVSKSKAERHGLTPADLVGLTDADFFSESHAQWARVDEENIMNTGVPVLGKLEKLIWPDGRETWALTSKLPLRDERGRIIGTFGLSRDVTAARKSEEALDRTRKELIETSRLAGMAEVATGVLHNVGNVLVSVNVTTELLGDTLRNSKVPTFVKITSMLREHSADLGDFLTKDPKGKLVPEFLASLAAHFAEERAHLIKEVDSLRKHVEHIKDIVTTQQSYAKMAGVVESLDADELMEDSLRMNSAALLRHDVRVERHFDSVPRVVVEKGKVLQILVNLIRNAKYACDDGGAPEKIITLRIALGAPGFVNLTVQDNGIGIPAENLTRIFQHGFTTRSDGHGFGLHSSVLAAKEMGGALDVFSAGRGQGATFTISLPAAPEHGVAPA